MNLVKTNGLNLLMGKERLLVKSMATNFPFLKPSRMSIMVTSDNDSGPLKNVSPNNPELGLTTKLFNFFFIVADFIFIY